MSALPAEAYLELVGLVARARHLRAAGRGRVPRDLPVRQRSLFRTHDRLGSRAYQPGDSVRLLILRDLLTRGQFNVRTYLAVSEVFVHVALDSARSLLEDPQAGPFARKLAFGLAWAGLTARQPTRLSFLGQGRPAPVLARRQQLGALVEALVRLRPEALPGADYRELLARDLGRPRTNTNLFVLTHVGHPLGRLEGLLRWIAARVRRAVVLPVVAVEEFAGAGPVTDPETGARVDLPPNRGAVLANYLDAAVSLGRYAGVPVEPLLVVDHRRDIETFLPVLVGASS